MECQTNKITNAQLDKLAMESSLPMNSLKILMPYSYFIKLADLNWHDILFLIENGFLSHEFAIEHALNEMNTKENYTSEVFELACLLQKEAHCYAVHQFLKILASRATEEEKLETRNKVLFILLNWVYEHKEIYEDPLKVVEFIYDDFEFPESMISFVRYMPTKQPLLSTIEANIDRIYSNWNEFLNKQKAKYCGSGQTT